jgi:TPP-dependent pyruvate/acetoin dehydrogenase alpha subunit
VLQGAWIVERGFASAEELERIDATVAEEVAAAVAHALDAPFPPESEVDQHVYA